MVNTSQTYPKLTLNGKCYTGPKVIFYGRGWYSWGEEVVSDMGT